MTTRAEKLVRFLIGKKVGVFVDDSNMYHAYRSCGWRIDFKRFKEFLSATSHLEFINYYVVVPNIKDVSNVGTNKFLRHITPHVTVKSKPIKYFSEVSKKGNMDVEITLDVVRQVDLIDVVIIMSGDSDFLELKEYVLKERDKAIIFFAFEENMASELRYCWHLYLNDFKEEFEFRK